MAKKNPQTDSDALKVALETVCKANEYEGWLYFLFWCDDNRIFAFFWQ